MKHLDLFSGIGGFSLGFERAGIQTVAFCEADPHCVAVLRRHWPRVPVFGNVRDLGVSRHFADVVTAGFPCQPFSTAARGRNNATDLWPEALRVIQECFPTWVVAENVPGIGLTGVDRLCHDLGELGYAVWPLRIDTSPPGRSRGRARQFWLAYTDGDGEPRRAEHGEMAGLRPLSPDCWPNDAPPVGMDDGLPGRMDRLRMLGNAVTPYAAELLGRAIVRATHSASLQREGT